MKTARSVVIILIVTALILSLASCIIRTQASDQETSVIREEETSEKENSEEIITDETDKEEEQLQTGTNDEEEDDPQSNDPETNTSSNESDMTENEKLAAVTGRDIDPDKPMVALTFDDGPSPDYTEKILDLLAEHGAVATFFEVGNIAEKYPEIIKKEMEYGCEIGSHTYSHSDLKKLSDDEAKGEIDKANDVFISITGKPASLLRPPYGRIGDRSKYANAPVVTWSVDTEDWRSRDADAVVQAVLDAGELDGKVVLMHSLYESTYEALKRVLDYLDENGYQCVTVSELAYYKHGELLEDGKFYGYEYFQ